MPAFTQCIHFQFSFFLQFECLLCFYFVLFCFFQADTNSILFHLVVENLILHIFLIIMIIMPCSGMFRNVPGCSMFRILSTPYFEMQVLRMVRLILSRFAIWSFDLAFQDFAFFNGLQTVLLVEERVIKKSILLGYFYDSGKLIFFIRDPLFFC